MFPICRSNLLTQFCAKQPRNWRTKSSWLSGACSTQGQWTVSAWRVWAWLLTPSIHSRVNRFHCPVRILSTRSILHPFRSIHLMANALHHALTHAHSGRFDDLLRHSRTHARTHSLSCSLSHSHTNLHTHLLTPSLSYSPTCASVLFSPDIHLPFV